MKKPRCEWCKRVRRLDAGKLCDDCRALCEMGVSKKAVKKFWERKRHGVGGPGKVGMIQAGGDRRVGDSQAVYRKRRSFRKK